MNTARFTRHPNTKRRQRVPAIHYSKHTIAAGLRRHAWRIKRIAEVSA